MSGNRIHWGQVGRSAAAVALAIVALAAAQSRALAELTVTDLTGTAVSGVGPFYQDVTDAIKDFGKGDYRGAFGRLENAKKLSPLLAPPEVMMARLYFDGNLTVRGIAILEQAVRRLPQDPEALVMLGERALGEGRWTEAGMLFEKVAPAVEAFRDNSMRRQDLQTRLYAGWSAADENNQNLAAAQKKLEEFLKIDSGNAAIHERLGRVLFRLGNGEAAYGQFKAAYAADPNMPPPELAMAGMFTDKANAEKWINFALSRSGQDVRTQLAVGQYRMRENLISEAKTHADQALKLDPDGLQSNLLAGLVARIEADYEGAVKHLSAAHLLAPADPAIMNNLALVLIERPDEASRRRALQFAELNVKQHPSNIDGMSTLGWINFRLNRRAEAERALTTAYKATALARDNKMTTDMGYYLAVMANDAGQTERAIELLKEALSMNQPFAYRKPAEELLAKLEKLDSSQDAKAKPGAAPRGAKTSGPPAAGEPGSTPKSNGKK